MDAKEHRSSPFVWAFIATLLLAGGGAELGVRIYRTYSTAAFGGFSTIDSPLNDAPIGQSVTGPYKPSRVITWRKFGPDNVEQRAVHFRTNNLGWVSSFDYGPKKPGEFRVAVLGNSLAASITNQTPWTDFVQRELRGSPATSHVIILNLGVAAAGFGNIAAIQSPIAGQLGADLVILNFTYGSKDLPNLSNWSAAARIQSGKIEIPLQCSLEGSGCRTSGMLRVPEDYVANPSDLQAAANASMRQERFLRIASRNSSLFFALRHPTENSDLEVVAMNHIRQMAARHPQFMVILNPLTWLPAKDRLPVMIMAEGIDFVDLTPLLPTAGAEEQSTWYNAPYDGHWSEKGAEIYGHLVAEVIRDWLRKNAANHAVTQTAN